MNRMKRFIKGSVLLLMVFTMACKQKDVPEKHNKQNDCHCQSDCKRVQEVPELPSDSVSIPAPALDIIEMRQQGNNLYLKLAFSGCDSDIDPELYVTSMMTSGPWQWQVYDCVVRESRVQLCAAHFVKEVCFNLSDLEKKYDYELIFQTREGSKSIKIVH